MCRIRDLNDEINKLIREKGHWERRIVDLGGPDYARAAPKVQDSQGFEIKGATGKGTGYRRARPPLLQAHARLSLSWRMLPPALPAAAHADKSASHAHAPVKLWL